MNVYIFLYYRPVHHVDLHSFPTRRSSDLIGMMLGIMLPLVLLPLLSIFVYGFGKGPGVNPRSEEHTSELQSRFDIVCRLLLGKKKHNDIGLRKYLVSSKDPSKLDGPLICV